MALCTFENVPSCCDWVALFVARVWRVCMVWRYNNTFNKVSRQRWITLLGSPLFFGGVAQKCLNRLSERSSCLYLPITENRDEMVLWTAKLSHHTTAPSLFLRFTPWNCLKFRVICVLDRKRRIKIKFAFRQRKCCSAVCYCCHSRMWHLAMIYIQSPSSEWGYISCNTIPDTN